MPNYTFLDHFGKDIPSYPPREVLENYILGRAKKHKVEEWVKLKTLVEDVSCDKDGVFTVNTRHLPSGKRTSENFSHVVCAAGHFSTPNVPSFPGFE